MARAMQEEFGEKAAHAAGVAAWAKADLQHSERDVERVIRKQKLSLDVPIGSMSVEEAKLPCIRPSAWLKWLFDKKYWHHLSGLDRIDPQQSEEMWSGFWERFFKLHPDFNVPEGFDSRHTAAVLLHGDEGRTLKKSPLMIVGFQSYLGMGCSVNGRSRKRSHKGELCLQVNYCGHSFTTRFVMSVLNKKQTDLYFDLVCEELAKDLSDCLLKGYTSNGVTFRLCVVGCKGDWPFLIKCANLNRHFLRAVRKRDRAGAGICHLCMAGTPGFPAEECGFTDPAWASTMPAPLPWNDTPVLLKHLPFDLANPSEFFQPDIWHTVHLGVGKCFAASTITVIVCNMQCYSAMNMEQRWEAVSAAYLGWCKSSRRQSYITKIAPSTVNYNEPGGAVGAWHKGAVTTNMLLFLEHFLATNACDDEDPRLSLALAAAQAMNQLFRFLYDAGVFLSKSEAGYVSRNGMFFERTYCQLARICFDKGKPQLYSLIPKLHSMSHMMLKVHVDAKKHHFCCSPLATACQQDEDLVGRVSRISRRVSIRQVNLRTFQRYLASCQGALCDAGLMVR